MLLQPFIVVPLPARRELSGLKKHFCGHGDKSFFKANADLFNEWPVIKKTLFNHVNLGRHSSPDMINPSVVWAHVAAALNGQASNQLMLVSIMFTLSVHTADVERGFSQFGIIKTELRNRLSATVMDALLRVKLHGSIDDVSNEASAMLEAAIDLWLDNGGAGRGSVMDMLQPVAQKLHEAVAKFHKAEGDILSEGEAKELAQVFGLDVTDEPGAQPADEQPDCGSDELESDEIEDCDEGDLSDVEFEVVRRVETDAKRLLRLALGG